MNRRIVLKESDLRSLVGKTIRKVLMEEFENSSPSSQDIQYYYRLLSKKGVQNYTSFVNLYKRLETFVSFGEGRDEWNFLHSEDWTEFFRDLRTCPEQMRFRTEYYGDTDEETITELKKLESRARKIPYPDLSLSSPSGFSDKAKSIKDSLSVAYSVYNEFMEFAGK